MSGNRDVDKLITSYFAMGLHHYEILAFLSIHHDMVIGERTLKRILKKLNLYRRKHYSNLEDVVSFIQQQLLSSGQLHGYRWMHQKCLLNGFVVKRSTILSIIKELDPVGVELRRKRRLRRRKYFSRGPNFLWHFDSYDKLKNYGIAINGCIDGFSRYIVWLEAGTTSSDPKVIAGYYIETVEAIGGCPRRLRSDLGTENRSVEQIQMFFRREPINASDRIYGEASFLYGTSPANQRIECWWGMLRKHCSQFWMNLFQKIKDEGNFSGSFLDKALIQFCFMKIIQEELNNVAYEWNLHRISDSRNSISPAGRPINMYELPELYRTKDYKCYLKNEEIELCKEYCVFKSEIPCDEDVYELCCCIMEEEGLLHSKDPYHAVNLYLFLRNEILTSL